MTTGGAWLGVDTAQWDFCPNGAGVTHPSLPLLQALTAAGLPSFVYFNLPAESPQPVPEPAPQPAPAPAPAPSSSGSFWGLVGGGAVVGLGILGKIIAGGVCGGAAIETGPGAVAAGGACAAAVP